MHAFMARCLNDPVVVVVAVDVVDIRAYKDELQLCLCELLGYNAECFSTRADCVYEGRQNCGSWEERGLYDDMRRVGVGR